VAQESDKSMKEEIKERVDMIVAVAQAAFEGTDASQVKVEHEGIAMTFTRKQDKDDE
jgi:hypothetical protein